MSLASSFSRILGRIMRIHKLTCEKYHGWSEGINDEVLRVE
jgi:hypothetical protein